MRLTFFQDKMPCDLVIFSSSFVLKYLRLSAQRDIMECDMLKTIHLSRLDTFLMCDFIVKNGILDGQEVRTSISSLRSALPTLSCARMYVDRMLDSGQAHATCEACVTGSYGTKLDLIIKPLD